VRYLVLIAEKAQQIVEEFSRFESWEDRYRELIRRGKLLSGLSEAEKIEKYRIKGCQSQVWLVPNYQDNMIIFNADSDATLVKGIIALLVEVYTNRSPDEILNYKPEFLSQIGITDHLSMNRSNGLASMLKQIQLYAVAYKALASRGE